MTFTLSIIFLLLFCVVLPSLVYTLRQIELDRVTRDPRAIAAERAESMRNHPAGSGR